MPNEKCLTIDMVAVAARFAPFVDKSGECWRWTGARAPSGYGAFRLRGNSQRAHRVAWELEHGAIPAGLLVCHRCDNPACVRPDHLFLGTQADNNADKQAKGRLRTGTTVGEKNNKAKLTVEKVRQIRALGESGKSQRKIASLMGVTRGAVVFVLKGATWKHVA